MLENGNAHIETCYICAHVLSIAFQTGQTMHGHLRAYAFMPSIDLTFSLKKRLIASPQQVYTLDF